jgi:hypothetical protein
MSYFTVTLRKKWCSNDFYETGHAPMVAHDGCLPEDQFERIGPLGHEIRHQKTPWCWSPIYGGMRAVAQGRMEYDSPRHLCHFCGKPTP